MSPCNLVCYTNIQIIDHHCPWVNNCIGHFNYGHFIRFLFYVDVACVYHLTMLTKRVLANFGGQFWEEPEVTELVFIILNYTFCIPVLLAVGGFRCVLHVNIWALNSLFVQYIPFLWFDG